MAARKPKDLQLAEIAYNTFYDAPEVRFDDTTPSYQMRWVRVVRAAGRSRAVPNGGGSQPVRETKAPKAKKKGPKLNGAQRDQQDRVDKALFTDKKYKDKSKEEIAARHRVAYRRKIYGEPVVRFSKKAGGEHENTSPLLT